MNSEKTDSNPFPIPKSIEDWMLSEIRAKTCPYRDFVIRVQTTVRNFFVILAIGEGILAFILLLKG